MRPHRMAMACALAFGTASSVAAGGAFAQSTMDQMKQQIDSLQKQIQQLQEQMNKMATEQKAAPPAPTPQAAAAPAAGGHEFLERKPTDDITFYTRGGEINLYGNLDLSIDYTTKGINGMVAADGSTPAGNGSWLGAISSNLSYLGVRGFQTLGENAPFNFIYQLETEIALSATSGTIETNSNTSNVVKGGLTSRNSFIGLQNPNWGAVKIGKTDAPYKTYTQRMNPFNGMIGDYAVVMGNTGGDNRVEFGTRVDHAIWYDSPNWSGANFSVLFSPGQNRANDSSNIPAGESDCAGGNIPGSGATPAACNDGGFSNLWSAAISYSIQQLYLVGAYELHEKVNRTSDLAGNGLPFDPNDVADESAWKVGFQYNFPTRTTFSFIWEDMRRNVPGYLELQNERQRTGFWVSAGQQLTDKDAIYAGLAQANRTPGDPGQHNTAPPPGLAGTANADNRAKMWTVAYKHRMDKNLTFYADYAATINHQFAHYDLGAGGRSVTTDCHDASNPDTSGFDPNGGAPKCWAGGHLQGFSVGVNYRF